jgi:hypothetical protein
MKHIKTFEDLLLEFNTSTNSIGKPIYKTKDGVDNFWKWFNGSKIVDDKGRPLVMYHGSNNLKDIDIFKSSKGHPYTFFAEDRYESLRYISDSSPVDKSLGTYYIKALKIYNPKNLNPKELKDLDEILMNEDIQNKFLFSIRRMGFSNLSEYITEIWNIEIEDVLEAFKLVLMSGGDNYILLETDTYQKYIRENGYDSFTTNEGDGLFFGNVAVYSPNQIKSATKNNGDFSDDNPKVNENN